MTNDKWSSGYYLPKVACPDRRIIAERTIMLLIENKVLFDEWTVDLVNLFVGEVKICSSRQLLWPEDGPEGVEDLIAFLPRVESLSSRIMAMVVVLGVEVPKVNSEKL
jgi:hypothetical protein